MAKRQVFHSSPTRDGWKVTKGGQKVSDRRTQRASEAAAIRRGKAMKNAGGFGQAVLHKTDGEIREERTYGKDPRKTPG